MTEPLAEIRDRTFRDEIVVLDDTSFIQCAFDHCDLRYHGGPVMFRDISMDGCTWSFGGAAQRAITLLEFFGLDAPQIRVPDPLLAS